jgi:hypothetical protein
MFAQKDAYDVEMLAELGKKSLQNFKKRLHNLS